MKKLLILTALLLNMMPWLEKGSVSFISPYKLMAQSMGTESGCLTCNNMLPEVTVTAPAPTPSLPVTIIYEPVIPDNTATQQNLCVLNPCACYTCTTGNSGNTTTTTTTPAPTPCGTFESLVLKVLDAEGGFSDRANDKGGATNRGIAWRTWLDVAKPVLGKEPTLDNLKAISAADAKKIYSEMFWNSINLDQVKDADIRYLIFDWYVNSKKWAITNLQKTLNGIGNSLTVDGKMGPQTINAINSANNVQIYNAYKQRRLDYYDKLATDDPSQLDNLKGWKNRVNKFKNKTATNSTNVNC